MLCQNSCLDIVVNLFTSSIVLCKWHLLHLRFRPVSAESEWMISSALETASGVPTRAVSSQWSCFMISPLIFSLLEMCCNVRAKSGFDNVQPCWVPVDDLTVSPPTVTRCGSSLYSQRTRFVSSGQWAAMRRSIRLRSTELKVFAKSRRTMNHPFFLA